MKLIPGKYFLFILATVLVVALGFMAVNTSKVKRSATMKTEEQMMMEKDEMEIKKMEEQSDSDDLDSIEKDVLDTNLDGINEDLEKMTKEL